MKKLVLTLAAIGFLIAPARADYRLVDHPRIFVNRKSLPDLARKADGPLTAEYAEIKAIADKALAEGVKEPATRFRRPFDMICLGIAYLVERQKGSGAVRYARAVSDFWGDGKILALDGSGHFGYYAMIYDWIYDTLTPEQRVRFADSLGEWLRYYTDTPEITLKNGYWWYNQTWGPAHLNTPNTRDGITPKLFVALAISGAGSKFEDDARRYLDSWAERVPAECVPAFEEMGEVWSESMGHGGYGPIIVIPWAFEIWRTATGQDWFQLGHPNGYLPGMTRWAAQLTVPFANHVAWIDDGGGSSLRAYAQIAPILGARYRDPVANAISLESFEGDWNDPPWNRFLSLDTSVKPSTPRDLNYPTAAWFEGAGHVYMRSAWGDPDATWAFFGCGPKFGGHSRDDEGSFLISKKGWLVLRAGGQGHNDDDYYAGGSLAFNIAAIYDPDEKVRRTSPGPNAKEGTKNENDGGLIRYVYTSHRRNDRGHIESFRHDDRFTYAAADLSQGYLIDKARRVNRQFLYIRGPKEFFVIFDRIEATKPDFPKTWFLHVPTMPEISGKEKVITPGHVSAFSGDTSTWLSDPAGEEGVLSGGKARAFLKTLLPKNAVVTRRGGDGHAFWGNPHNPEACYDHVGGQSLRPPIVPWRLEVEGPGGTTGELFLHVFEIADESAKKMSDVKLVERPNQAGAEISVGGQRIVVLFATEGPIGGQIKFGNDPIMKLE